LFVKQLKSQHNTHVKRSKATSRELSKLFGANVRLYRNIMRWSQEELAEQMNVSKNTIHEIETGKKFVRLQRLTDFAAVFNIEAYKLFLPENIRDYDANIAVAQYTEDAKDALENLLGDFLTNTKK